MVDGAMQEETPCCGGGGTLMMCVWLGMSTGTSQHMLVHSLAVVLWVAAAETSGT